MNVRQALEQYKLHKVDPPENLKPSDDPLDEKKHDAQTMSTQWWHIRGIGPKLALQLWNDGMRPSNIMQYLKKLPMQAQMYIIHKPLTVIPRKMAEEIVREFMPDVKNWEQVGSYRRGKETVGDIDILYWGPNLEGLLETLAKKHGKKWYVYARGDMKIGGMYTARNGTTVEIDIWIATPKNKHAMLLYSTGSKNWNIIMRRNAKSKGLKLNQYGVFKGDELIPTKTEADIFEAIGMKYREPKDREK